LNHFREGSGELIGLPRPVPNTLHPNAIQKQTVIKQKNLHQGIDKASFKYYLCTPFPEKMRVV
jgi:hypothetical protein